MSFDLLTNNILRYISLTPDETELFCSMFKQKSLAKDEFLLREGEICRYENFVCRGCLKIYYTDKDTTEHIIDFCVEEWWADDLHSFFTQTPATSNIKAIEDSEILQISKYDLETLYQRIPKIERFFRLLFQNAYITQREQINQAVSVPAEERYFSFLKKKPYAEKRFSQKDIASYLGITPQFLSTLKKKMRQVNVD